MRKMDRREFLKTCGRIFFVGGITLTTGKLLVGKQVSFKECSSNGICRKCRINKRCKQPQALSFRRAKEKLKT